MASGHKTGGRSKGTPNKLPEVQKFIRRVEDFLGKSDPKLKPFALERLACRFITGEDTKVAFGVWSKFMEYKFGKPVQPISGKDGEPIQLQVVTNATFPEP